MTNEIENEVCLAESPSAAFISKIKNHNFHIVESFNKAAEIDLPASISTEKILDGTKTNARIGYELILDTGKYTIRSNLRDAVKTIANEEHIKDLATTGFGEQYNKNIVPFIEAAVAGPAGGAFKYGLTGQNIYVGMANNFLYELCNNFDSCSKNPVNLAIATVVIETLDVVAQEYIAAVSANPLLAAAAGYSYYSKMSSLYIKTFYQNAATGLIAGGSLAAAGEYIYEPNQELASNVVKYISSSGNHSIGMNSTIDHAFAGLVTQNDFDFDIYNNADS